jgi:GNAT superfamily N-acetyltransferase
VGNLIITDFTRDHVEKAQVLAMENYHQERRFVPVLPPIEDFSDLQAYADNGLGVAAFKGERMLGFLLSVPPFQNAFGSTSATGVFSPLGANGAVKEDRSKIYAQMYQAAGEKWARAGASSHAVCLYAHDQESQKQFFRYGFGLRCVDAIRSVDEIDTPACAGYQFKELAFEEFSQILPLRYRLDGHMAESPAFMPRKLVDQECFLKEAERSRAIYFAAKENDQIVAYIGAAFDGETFVCDAPGYLHVNSAYCLPEHRGKSLHQKLLGLLVQKLKMNGYTRLGVDFESINPNAYAFWLKYFEAYGHSVVRRIDEAAVTPD